MASQQIVALRRRIEQRFPGAVPSSIRRTERGVPTGVAALDDALPGGGGLPRGRTALWRPGSGAAALLRAACAAAAGRGERAAWVDGAGVVGGELWASGPLLLRPAEERDALECAEELLRSGGFALVVLSGAEAGRTQARRLSRAAREGGAAFARVGGDGAGAHVRLAAQTPAEGYAWRRGPFGEPARVETVTVRVRISGRGRNRCVECSCPVGSHELRLSVDPGLADRRGARS